MKSSDGFYIDSPKSIGDFLTASKPIFEVGKLETYYDGKTSVKAEGLIHFEGGKHKAKFQVEIRDLRAADAILRIQNYMDELKREMEGLKKEVHDEAKQKRYTGRLKLLHGGDTGEESKGGADDERPVT